MMEFNKQLTEKDFLKTAKGYFGSHGKKPNKEFCPQVYLVWGTTKGAKYKNLTAGGRKTYNGRVPVETQYAKAWRDEGKAYTAKANQHYLWLYARPDYNRRLIELATITIPTKRTLDHYEFEFVGPRFCMSMDKPKLWVERSEGGHTLVITDGCVHNVPQSWYSGWYHNTYKITTWICSGFHCLNSIARDVFRAYLRNFGVDEFYDGYSIVNTSEVNLWSFSRSITCGPNRKTTKNDTIGDELAAIELKPIENKLNFVFEKTYRHPDGVQTSAYNCYYQKIDDETCVFRYFTPLIKRYNSYGNYLYTNSAVGEPKGSNYLNGDIKFSENTRVYVKNKKTYLITMSTSYNGETKYFYKKMPNTIKQIPDNHVYVANRKEMLEDPQFKYVKSIFERYDSIPTMLTAMNKPIIEQLSKIGADEFVNCLAEDNETMAKIKTYFGKYNAKKKTLQDIVGMTPKQIMLINEAIKKNKAKSDNHHYYFNDTQNLYTVSFLFELLTNKPCTSQLNNISQYDLKTIQACLDIMNDLSECNVLQRSWYRWERNGEKRYSPTFKALFPISYEDKPHDQRINYILRMKRFCEQVGLGINVLSENVRMYNNLNADYRPANISFDYKCASDISRVHDSLVELQRMQDEERRRLQRLAEDQRNKELEKKMKKLDEQRKLKEFEDDTYLIRLPKKLSELTDEGVTQRICIGGYINSHASGNANIYFLRKKAHPDVPFFAIEERDGRIIQIHGYCNKWLGADDDSFAAVPFVMRWLKRNNLRCSNQILTSRACGYSMGSSFRELPTID